MRTRGPRKGTCRPKHHTQGLSQAVQGTCKGPALPTRLPDGIDLLPAGATSLPRFPCDIICLSLPVVVQAGGKINEMLRGVRVSSLLPAAPSLSVKHLGPMISLLTQWEERASAATETLNKQLST